MYLRGFSIVVQWGSEMARSIAREMDFLPFWFLTSQVFCIDSTRRGHYVALIVSEMITLTWCESVGRLSSNVHARVHGFSDRAKVLLDMSLLDSVYFAVS